MIRSILYQIKTFIILHFLKPIYVYYKIRDRVIFAALDSDIIDLIGHKDEDAQHDHYIELRTLLFYINFHPEQKASVQTLELGQVVPPGYVLLCPKRLRVNPWLDFFSKKELLISKAITCGILAEKWGKHMVIEIIKGTYEAPEEFRLYIYNRREYRSAIESTNPVDGGKKLLPVLA